MGSAEMFEIDGLANEHICLSSSHVMFTQYIAASRSVVLSSTPHQIVAASEHRGSHYRPTVRSIPIGPD